MKERIVIVFVAVILGLLVTTVGFFIYQTTKKLPDGDAKIAKNAPTPTPPDGILLAISEPKNEDVFEKRSISVKGQTNPGNTVVISSNSEDIVVEPTSSGEFSTNITIDTGTNKVIARAITPDGSVKVSEFILSFTTEEF